MQFEIMWSVSQMITILRQHGDEQKGITKLSLCISYWIGIGVSAVTWVAVF